jgi:aminoglycoside phosphotransferase (APT) family kinase protein
MAEILTQLVRQLINDQFPEWKALSIKPVLLSGHDNRTFHLGEKMTIRLPSSREYVPQIEKEARWLPILAKNLSLPISYPIAQGKPTTYYPFPWSINHYLEGECASLKNIADMGLFAKQLAKFLEELQKVNTEDAPITGEHNFFRGANPSVYSEQVENALLELSNDLPTQKLRTIWKTSVTSEWMHPPVWIHGDIAPGNILVKNGKLCGVIDFGIMGIGDPACDYAMAWTFFDDHSRRYFLQGLDTGTIDRARGWALWKALITYNTSNHLVADNAKFTLNAILDEYEKSIRRKQYEYTK